MPQQNKCSRGCLILTGAIALLIMFTGCITNKHGFVKETVNISGSASGTSMESYLIEIGAGKDPDNWTTLGVELADGGLSQINESILASWNTSLLPDGNYTIRLTVTDSNGRKSRDLAYVTIDNDPDYATKPCPEWSCSNLIEGANAVNVGVTKEQYGSNMNCSITCECSAGMHIGMDMEGYIETFYDFLYLDNLIYSGNLRGFYDSFNETVNITFTSDYSIDGSSGNYSGFNVERIICSPYCLSWSTPLRGVCEEYISRVELNTGNRISSKSYYSDYTASTLTALTTGQTYTLQVEGTVEQTYMEHAIAWIDFNQDLDFDDPGEEIDMGAKRIYDTHTFSKTFNVPLNATSGHTRMRVILGLGEAPPACGGDRYGETEDYSVEIIRHTYNVTVSRDLPVNASGGQDVTVTLALDVNESGVPDTAKITEYYPAGWIVSSISDSGEDDGKRIIWLLTSEGGQVVDRNLTYVIHVPESTLNDYGFNGTVEYGGELDPAISGDSLLSIEGACPLLGDQPPCGVVNVSEIIDLINHWYQEGCTITDVITLINTWAAG